MKIKELKELLLTDEKLGTHLATGTLLNCINNLVAMIPDDNIRNEIDSCISECENNLEQQENEE